MHSRLRLSLLLLLPLCCAHAQSRAPNHRVSNFSIVSGTGGYGTYALPLRDHDGDGFADYAVAAPNANDPAGAVGPGVVYVHSGRTGLVIRQFIGDQIGSRFGEAMADPGDLNGDLVPDLVVSAIDHDAVSGNGGRLYAFSGLDSSVIWTKDGVDSGNLGKAMAATGDLTGDTVPDVIVGESSYGVGLLGRGRVVIVNGATGGTVATGDGPVGFSSLGVSLCATPGGATYVSDALGRVYVVGPPAAGTVALVLTYDRPVGANGTAQLASITGPGGVARLLIGRRNADSNGLSNNGRVELIEGGAVLMTIEGASNVALLGSRVATGRDVDGDGLEEILYTQFNGSPIQPDPVTVMRQDGTIVEVVSTGAANAGTLLSIPDTTGDGRGEWLQAIFSGQFGMAECHLFSRGLDEPVVTLQAGILDVDYAFDLSPLRAGAIYWTLFSLSGTSPGAVFSPAWPRLPLNVDPMTNVFFVQANTAVLPGTIGTLDGSGAGTCSLVFPGPLAAIASGWRLSNCVIAFGTGGWPPVAVSNPRTVFLP